MIICLKKWFKRGRHHRLGRNVDVSPSKYLESSKLDYARAIEGKKTSMKCGSNQNRVENLSMSPMQPCEMKLETFKGILEYVQDIQPYREIDTDFRNGVKMSYETEFYEGVWGVDGPKSHDQWNGSRRNEGFDEDQDERTKIAMIRYESRLISVLTGKFENFHAGKVSWFTDGLFGERKY